MESQQIAKFAQEAASGGYESFDMLDATRTSIQVALDKLKQGDAASGLPAFASSRGMASASEKQLGELIATWAPVSENAEKILLRKELVLNLADSASAFSASVPQLQAQMDEVVRAMSESGAPSTRTIHIAVRQIVLADRMLRYVTQILQGGAAAVSAADRFSRDYSMFGQVLVGLDAGSAEQGIRRVDSASGRQALGRVADGFAKAKQDVEFILDASTQFEVKESSDTIFVESEQLLAKARALNTAIDAMPEAQRAFPSVTLGVAAGVLAVFGLAGLLYSCIAIKPGVSR